MITTENQITTTTKLKRIAWLSSKDKSKKFNNLMHLFNEESLTSCYHELNGKKALGIDEVSKADYGIKLQENIQNLVARLKSMSYIPGPIKEVKIPKEGSPGKFRSLGISNFEDKIVQKMMQKVLESIYDPIFLKGSYGFRPGIGCHDAIKGLINHLYEYEAETIIDIDLANFFGTIDRKIMLEILQEKIRDKKLLRYIVRMFKAGILSQGDLTVSTEGVVQGSVCSPIIANIFAHYVIDQWIEEVVKKHCKGKVEIFRYCDDGVIACRYEADAIRIEAALTNRLSKYKLKLNEDKTKMVKFSKASTKRGEKQESFDFLGFTFYIGKTRKGRIVPQLKSCGKRIRSKLKKVNDWCKDIRNKFKLEVIWELFCSKLRGHIQYYGVSYNSRKVSDFIRQSARIMLKWLNRRSQRRSLDWNKFNLFIKMHPLPKAKIYHSLFVKAV